MDNLKITMGPQAATARFWNVVQEEDEAEITIYGEIMQHRPTNWWTGEPEEGLFTTPEGFLEDLAKVQNAKNVTVRINSVGGDLYTAIGICNRLKELTGNTVAIIDGIAASAATIIAMGCGTIKAYAGSMFMVHEALTTLCGMYNHKALMEVNKRLEAANQAAAETYNAKTQMGVDKIRNAMAKETWLTGTKAVEDGWIDEVIDGEDPAMSLSADMKMITVNGINMSAEGFCNLPQSIKVSATPQATAVANKKIHKEEAPMTLEELLKAEPELVAQIRNEAQQTAAEEGRMNERARLKAIQEIANTVGDAELVNEAMYGENACTAQELAFRAMKKQASLGQEFLNKQEQDANNSGAKDVQTEPVPGTEATMQAEEEAIAIANITSAFRKE